MEGQLIGSDRVLRSHGERPRETRTSLCSRGRFILLALCLCLARSVHAADADAEFRAHFARAQQLYERKDYEGSIKELQAAHAIRPLPRLLLNIGQLQRKLGHDLEAMAVYEIYLAAEPHPPPEVAQDLHDYMERMRNTPRTPAVKIRRELRQRPRPLWRIATGTSLIGVGVLVAAFGIGALAVNGNEIGTPTPPAMVTDMTYHTAGVGGALLGVGIALAAAGAVVIALPGEKRWVEISAGGSGSGAGPTRPEGVGSLRLAGSF